MDRSIEQHHRQQGSPSLPKCLSIPADSSAIPDATLPQLRGTQTMQVQFIHGALKTPKVCNQAENCWGNRRPLNLMLLKALPEVYICFFLLPRFRLNQAEGEGSKWMVFPA